MKHTIGNNNNNSQSLIHENYLYLSFALHVVENDEIRIEILNDKTQYK